MGRLTGKAAVITGGAKGLGLEFARALIAEGAGVLVVDIADGADAEQAGAHFMHADITGEGAAERIADAAMDAFGQVDILINNAALYAGLPMARYDRIEPDLWDEVMRVNIGGTWRMIRAIGPLMEKRRRGKIVNITSGTVMKGMPGMAHYVASKGALAALTRTLSREMGGNGVCVNSLAPGLTLSSSILENAAHIEATRDRVLASRAIKRDGQPADLIGALLFLCSDDSDFVTGQTIAVDGGSVNT
ncbi:SDR family NAD(P)-dependent oxidoreductase [Rhodophyticola porphyridii]|uniref:SDR family oxidoreductase n=1 Tax=Rhodophyticola porphyridii TaxID=1852017 RepID=A0A3L9Y1E0_9RHOB|nr:SDR family oxidoreductase [Rhodophyticola porphyridii]RMA41225.1 SDR family oxidoreductase [Rhodophyticola porphyridii]